MEIQASLNKIFSLQAGQRLICAAAIYACTAGIVNLAAFVVFQTCLSTKLALGCGAIAALCGVLADDVWSEYDDTILEYMLVAGAVGAFATAFFAGVGLGLSLYAVCMFAMAHIAVTTYHNPQPD